MKHMKKRICAVLLLLALSLSAPLSVWGVSPSIAPSPSPSGGETSVSPSASPPVSPSASPPVSPSASPPVSPSASPSVSSSASPTVSPSASEDPNASPSPTPTPQPDDVSPEEMEIQAKAAILVDISRETPEILFEQNAHDKMYPASITKVMTALIVLEAVEDGKLSLDQTVSGSSAITSDLAFDGSTQNIQPGEEMTVENLLYCMLISSANETCNILAEAVDGSISAFHDHMNQRAKELGCENTHFVNAHGLPSTEHYTTAYDIFLICQAAIKHPLFQTICSTKSYTIPATNLSEERVLHTTNFLISNQRVGGYYYSCATGIKTGSTGQAGYCLAASATQGGRTVISVVLGAENIKLEDGTIVRNSFKESRRLLKWGLDYFRRKTLIDPATPVRELTVRLSKETDYLVLKPEGTLEATLFKSIDPSEFEQKIVVNADPIDAPVTEGQVLGTITLSYQGKDYGTLNLVAVSSVSRSQWLFFWDLVRNFFENPFIKLLIVILIVLFVVYIVRRKLGLSGKNSAKARNKRHH
jgi:D-alanyl-D-alanine carboxypeptidase (penicillin-binding protein 5/6)